MSRAHDAECDRLAWLPPDLLPDDAAAMEAAFGGFDAGVIEEMEEHQRRTKDEQGDFHTGTVASRG